MLRDLKSKLWQSRAISPVSVGDNTAAVSEILDTANFQGASVGINLGSIADADATFQVLLEHADISDMTGAEAVPDEYLTGIEGAGAGPTGASFRYDSDNLVKTLGYTGPKRYLRLTITPSGNSGAALISAMWNAFMKRVGPNTSQNS